MSKRIVCLGELLLRLGAPGHELLLQSPLLAVHVGGAEANVALSLALFGERASMVSALPANALGDAAIGELRRHGVDTAGIVRVEGARMGLYFIATGALQRPSDIIYDRAHSAFADVDPDRFDWDALLDGANALHVSGVTPAIGANGTELALRAVRAARARGLMVSFDGNFRAKLWAAWSGDAATITRALIDQADLVFADHRDIAIALAHAGFDGEPDAAVRSAAAAAFAAFPRLSRLCTTIRTQHSVDHHALTAISVARDGGVERAPSYDMPGIVDRIGGGDAFAAGVLHGLRQGMGDGAALHFGLGAACLKHSVPGDFNRVSAADVSAFVGTGRFDVRR